jgi:hypothetical protein
MMIARKIGLDPKINNSKDEVVIMINEKLQNKNVKEGLKNADKEIVLNGISVLAREDGYINATAL